MLENPLAAIQMGLIYVNPGRSRRQSRRAAVGARHPRDLRAHGHERRGDRRAHRRRPHLRQGARRGRRQARSAPSPKARTSPSRAWAGRAGHESGMGDHTITSGIEGAWTPTPINWDMSYFHMLLDYEYELVRSPAGAKQWQPVDRSREDTGARRAQPGPPRADDDDHGRHGDEGRPELPRDLRALPRRSGGLRRRLRPRLVQAVPPRHGAQGPLPRPRGAGRGPDLAGPAPTRGLRAHRRGRRRRAQGQDRRIRPDRSPNWSRPPGPPPRPIAAPTIAAAPTARASGWRRRRIGRSTSRPAAAPGCSPSYEDDQGRVRRHGRQAGLASPT